MRTRMRQIGPVPHVVGVVELLAQDDVGEAEGQGRRRAGPDHDHVVPLGGGGRVLAGDHHDPRALEARLGQPVRVGHLGGDPVHAPDDDASCSARRRADRTRPSAGRSPSDGRAADRCARSSCRSRVPPSGLVGADLADAAASSSAIELAMRYMPKTRVMPSSGMPPRNFSTCVPAPCVASIDRLVVVLRAQPLLALLAGVGLGDVLQGGGDDRRPPRRGRPAPTRRGPVEVLRRRAAVACRAGSRASTHA